MTRRSGLLIVVGVLALACPAYGSGAPGTSVKDAAALTPTTPEQQALKETAECICTIIDECLEGDRKTKAKEAKDNGCMSLPTEEEAVAFLTTLFMSRDPNLSEAAASQQARAQVAGALGQNNAWFSKEDPWIFFTPGFGKLGLWTKKVVIHDEVGDFVNMRDDVAVKLESVEGQDLTAHGKLTARALAKYYLDLKGYLDDLDFLAAHKPEGDPPEDYSNAVKRTKAAIAKALGALDAIMDEYEEEIPGGPFKNQINTCRNKARGAVED